MANEEYLDIYGFLPRKFVKLVARALKEEWNVRETDRNDIPARIGDIVNECEDEWRVIEAAKVMATFTRINLDARKQGALEDMRDEMKAMRAVLEGRSDADRGGDTAGVAANQADDPSAPTQPQPDEQIPD